MKFRRNPDYQDLRSEMTPEDLFWNRRKLMAASGAIGAGLAFAGTAHGDPAPNGPKAGAQPAPGTALKSKKTAWTISDSLASEEAVVGYCNFYEFGTDKSDPARYADKMTVSPWSIEVSGETGAAGKYAVEDLVDYGKLEERVYRHRCVEAWSMVVPWVGVPLSSIISKLKPGPKAKFVQFETYLNPSEMRGVRYPVIDWPYVEGLRIDEAMNELAFVAVGVYGKALPKQNGAPLRTVVPWKYGFKGTKSIVKIRFVEKMPDTAWNKANAHEYGFYSNVNPNVDHPRWSQASERVIGGKKFNERRKTEIFNGYEKQVASLYSGMDLTKNF
ncbi:MAG: protein-methionine-sulfoxide reductase catalytic subunit MsrP [Hyphomonadaceae bacterium]